MVWNTSKRNSNAFFTTGAVGSVFVLEHIDVFGVGDVSFRVFCSRKLSFKAARRFSGTEVALGRSFYTSPSDPKILKATCLKQNTAFPVKKVPSKLTIESEQPNWGFASAPLKDTILMRCIPQILMTHVPHTQKKTSQGSRERLLQHLVTLPRSITLGSLVVSSLNADVRSTKTTKPRAALTTEMVVSTLRS